MNTLFLILALTLTFASAQNWTTAVLSAPRQGLVAVSYLNYSFFAGGENSSTGLNVVDIYNGNSGTWSTGTISAGTGIAAASASGIVYFAGGLATDGTVSPYIDSWNVSAAAFRQRVNLTQARQGLAGASLDNYVLFAGGSITNTANNATNVVDVYNGSAWSTAVLSQARSGLVGVSAGDWVIFAGGWVDNVTASSTVDLWNSQNNTWIVRNLAQARAEFAAVAWGNLVYFAGGLTSNGTTFLNSIEIFDINTATFVQGATLSVARANLAAAAWDDLVYFAGGRAASGFSNVIDIWSNGTSESDLLSVARGDLASTVDDQGTIFFAGGVAQGGVSAAVDVGRVEVDPTTTPTPTVTPTVTPTPSPTNSTPTPTPTETETPTPTPTPTPNPLVDCNTTGTPNCYQNFESSTGTVQRDTGFTTICGWWSDYRDCVTNTSNNCDAATAEPIFEEQCSNVPEVSEICDCNGQGLGQPANARLLELMNAYSDVIISQIAGQNGVVDVLPTWTYDAANTRASITFSYEDTVTDAGTVVSSLQEYLAGFFAQSSTRFNFEQQKKRSINEVQQATYGVTVQEAQDNPSTGSASSVVFSLGFTMMIALFNVFF